MSLWSLLSFKPLAGLKAVLLELVERFVYAAVLVEHPEEAYAGLNGFKQVKEMLVARCR